MAGEVIVAPEAHLDISEAYGWYEQRRPGLGEEFLTSVEAALAGMARFPSMCPKIFRDYRRCLLRRFPYAVYYEVEESRVTVYAVFHTSRDPEKWRQRLA
jgi:plasmid stabilization system protein ParE